MGYSEKEVAECLGVKNPDTIHRWETGEAMPSTLMLFKLCVLYHVLPAEVYPKLYKEIAKEMGAKLNKQLAKTKQSKQKTK